MVPNNKMVSVFEEIEMTSMEEDGCVVSGLCSIQCKAMMSTELNQAINRLAGVCRVSYQKNKNLNK